MAKFFLLVAFWIWFGDSAMKMYAHVSLDMDENRIAMRWWVFVYDENDNLVEMRPFAEKREAEEYAEQFGVER